MKTVGRILIILLAALIVVGVTMAVTSPSSTAQAAPSFQEGQIPQMGDGNFVSGQRPEGDRDGGSALGWLSHLIPVAGIIFVVVMIERVWGKIFKPRLAQ